MKWPDLLSSLVRGDDLTRDETAWAMEQVLTGSATAAQLAGFVIALRSKGETVEELVGLADTMLEFATPVEIPGLAVDVVGTGGDRANTVNISTMAAIVAAGAGAASPAGAVTAVRAPGRSLTRRVPSAPGSPLKVCQSPVTLSRARTVSDG